MFILNHSQIINRELIFFLIFLRIYYTNDYSENHDCCSLLHEVDAEDDDDESISNELLNWANSVSRKQYSSFQK